MFVFSKPAINHHQPLLTHVISWTSLSNYSYPISLDVVIVVYQPPLLLTVVDHQPLLTTQLTTVRVGPGPSPFLQVPVGTAARATQFYKEARCCGFRGAVDGGWIGGDLMGMAKSRMAKNSR